MKKILRAIGIVDAIAIIIFAILYFTNSYRNINILPILLAILIICIIFEIVLNNYYSKVSYYDLLNY